MTYIGDFVSGANIVHKFTSRDFSTGAPFNMANGVAAIYKDGNTTLFNTGVTFTNSYNNGVGFHEVAVNTLNTTRYTNGNEYAIILTAGTVNAVSVANETVATFSIQNRGVKQVSGDVTGNVGGVTNNVTVGSIANNAVNELAFDKTAGTFHPLGIIDQGIAQNTAANNIKLRSGVAFADNEIVGGMVVITGGNGVGQTRAIIAYNKANNLASVDTWTTTPDATTAYKVFAGPPGPLNLVAVQLADITANGLKKFFNTNSTTNYAASVAGSVVKEIADNAAGSGTSADALLNRLNSNLILGNQSFTLNGNVGSVTNNVGGSVAGSVGSVVANVNTQFVANNGIFAASLAANAVTGAKVANDVDIRSVTGNVGNVTSNIGGSLAGSVGSVTANVTVGTIANNAITAVTINANAITGAKVFNDVDIRNVNGNVTVGTIANNAITGVVFNANAITGRSVANDVDVRNINGNITGSVAGSVGSVTGAVGSVTNLNALVKAQVIAALSVDTYAEPGQGTPGTTLDLASKVGYLFKFLRNRVTQTNNTLSIYAGDATTVDQKATVSDDGTTYTRNNIVTGP